MTLRATNRRVEMDSELIDKIATLLYTEQISYEECRKISSSLSSMDGCLKMAAKILKIIEAR